MEIPQIFENHSKNPKFWQKLEKNIKKFVIFFLKIRNFIFHFHQM